MHRAYVGPFGSMQAIAAQLVLDGVYGIAGAVRRGMRTGAEHRDRESRQFSTGSRKRGEGREQRSVHKSSSSFVLVSLVSFGRSWAE